MQAYNREQTGMEFYRLRLSKSKLKAVTRTSALFSGFAMVAMVELSIDYRDDPTIATKASEAEIYSTILPALLNISTNVTRQVVKKIAENTSNNPRTVPQSVLILYALVTCLLIGVNMLALMISTCILPQIEAVAFENTNQNVLRNDFSNRASQIHLMPTPSHNYPCSSNPDETEIDDNFLSLNKGMLSPNRNDNHRLRSPSAFNAGHSTNIVFPYMQYHRYIELSWISSTVIGIFLFLVEIGLICFIKFYPISPWAALTGAFVMTPILILFVVFTYTFYKGLALFKVDLTKQVLSQIDHSLLPPTHVI